MNFLRRTRGGLTAKSHWELLYDWWISDFRFELEQVRDIALLLRRHPDKDDTTGILYRHLLVVCRDRIKQMAAEYTRVYGDRPPLRRLGREVEDAS